MRVAELGADTLLAPYDIRRIWQMTNETLGDVDRHFATTSPQPRSRAAHRTGSLICATNLTTKPSRSRPRDRFETENALRSGGAAPSQDPWGSSGARPGRYVAPSPSRAG